MNERLKGLGIYLSGKYWLYAITDGHAIKFGSAKNVANRLRKLQGANSKELTLLASIEAYKGTEAVVHKALYRHRIRGEWFEFCQESLRYVELYKSGDMERLYEYLEGWLDRALNVTQ